MTRLASVKPTSKRSTSCLSNFTSGLFGAGLGVVATFSFFAGIRNNLINKVEINKRGATMQSPIGQ